MTAEKVAYETAVAAAQAAHEALLAHEATMPEVCLSHSPHMERWNYLADSHLKAQAKMRAAKKAWDKTRACSCFEDGTLSVDCPLHSGDIRRVFEGMGL